MTFGPELRYVSVPKDNPQNQSPAAQQQYYGRAKIDPASRDDDGIAARPRRQARCTK